MLHAVILLSGLVWAALSPSPSSTYDEAVRRAGEAFSRNDPVAALALLDQALRGNPEGAGGFMLLGKIYRTLGRHAEAAAALRRAATLMGETTQAGQDATCEMAAALASQEKNIEAIEALRGVLQVAPRRPGVHRDIGEIELALGRLDAAATELRAEIALHEEDPPSTVLQSAHELLGIAAYRMGDDDTALASLAKAPATTKARYHFGLALARRGKNEEAAATLREVLAREPDHRGALQAMARVAGALGLEPERRAALERFQKLYMADEKAHALRIKVKDLRAEAERRRTAGDAAGAVAPLEEAARLSPDDLDILFDLGRLHLLAGNRGQAEAAWRSVLERDPLRADAHYRLGRLLADRGDVPEALASLEEAARIEPMSTTYRVGLAQLYLRAGQADDGVRELRLARRLNPDDPDSYFNLGVALAQAGSLAEAAGELEEAVRRGYREPVVHQVLAQIYRGLGDAERADREQKLFENLGEEARP